MKMGYNISLLGIRFLAQPNINSTNVRNHFDISYLDSYSVKVSAMGINHILTYRQEESLYINPISMYA